MGNIRIWTDGSIDRQHGKGAWAALIEQDGVRTAWWGLLPEPCTSNQAELAGAAQAIGRVAEPTWITLVTDSRYVERVATSKAPARANPALAALFRQKAAPHQITVKWIRGHAGVEENEFVDGLAKLAIQDPDRLRKITHLGHIAINELLRGTEK